VQRRHRVTVDDMALPVTMQANRGTPATTGSSERRDTALTPPAPATKYRPPAAAQSQVTRDRLMAILRAAGRRRLILIYAPSGYGKTTLVAQWRTELTSSGCERWPKPMPTVEVPADRYWGAQTQRSLQHFSIGNDRMPIEVYRTYGLIKKACALVNERAGRLEPWRAR
jgi:hypothetical protein